jgi:hypothetical protein
MAAQLTRSRWPVLLNFFEDDQLDRALDVEPEDDCLWEPTRNAGPLHRSRTGVLEYLRRLVAEVSTHQHI